MLPACVTLCIAAMQAGQHSLKCPGQRLIWVTSQEASTLTVWLAAMLRCRPDCTVHLCSKDAAVGCLARSRHTACLADAELLRSRPDSTVCVCREPEYPAIPADLHEIGALKRSVQALQEVASSVSLGQQPGTLPPVQSLA